MHDYIVSIVTRTLKLNTAIQEDISWSCSAAAAPQRCTASKLRLPAQPDRQSLHYYNSLNATVHK